MSKSKITHVCSEDGFLATENFHTYALQYEDEEYQVVIKNDAYDGSQEIVILQDDCELDSELNSEFYAEIIAEFDLEALAEELLEIDIACFEQKKALREQEMDE